jgi:hypothetical protein
LVSKANLLDGGNPQKGHGNSPLSSLVIYKFLE